MPDASEGSQVASARRPKRPRWRRIVRWTLLSILGLVVLFVALVWLVLGNLNSDFIKSRIQSLAKSAAGLEIDYDDLDISIRGGITATRISIATPSRFRSHSDRFITLTGVDIGANLLDVAMGDLDIERVHIASVHVSVVRDELGATTLTELFPPSTKKNPETSPSKPSPPLSLALHDLPELAVKSLRIDSIEASYLEIGANQLIREQHVSSLALVGAIHLDPGNVTGTKVSIANSDAAGLVYRLLNHTTDIENEVAVAFDLSLASKSAQQLSLAVKSDLLHQDMLTTVAPIRSLIAMNAQIGFEENERTVAHISKLAILGDAVDLSGSAELPDTNDGSVAGLLSASGAIRLSTLPVEIPGISISDVDLDFNLADIIIRGDEVAGAFAVKGTIASAALEQEDSHAQIAETTLDIKGAFENGERGTATIAFSAGSASTSSGANEQVNLHDLLVNLETGDVTWKRETPSQVMAPARLQVSIGSMTSESDETTLVAKSVGATIIGKDWLASILANRPLAATAEIPLGFVEVRSPGSRLRLSDTHMNLAAINVVPDPAAPYGVTGEVRLNGSVAAVQNQSGPQQVTVSGVHFEANGPLSAQSGLGFVEFAKLQLKERGTPPTVVRDARFNLDATSPLLLAPGERGSPRAIVSGHIKSLRAPSMGGSLPSFTLRVDKSGNSDYTIAATTNTRNLRFDGQQLPQLRSNATISVSLARPKITAELKVSGPEGPSLTTQLQGDFDLRRGVLNYTFDLSLSKLDAISEELRTNLAKKNVFDAGAQRIEMTAKGNLRGLLVNRGGSPSLAPDPIKTLRGTQSLQIDVAEVHVTQGGREVSIPSSRVTIASEHGKGGAGTARVEFDVGEIAARIGTEVYSAKGLTHVTTASFDNAITEGQLTVRSETKLASAKQPQVEGLEIADLLLLGHATVKELQSVSLHNLVLSNPKSGTHLELKGSLERHRAPLDRVDGQAQTVPGREALTVHGTLTQKLNPLVGLGVAKSASGSVSVPFQVESGDLLSFLFDGRVKAQNVSIATAGGEFEITGLDGVIPITEELAVLPTGVVLLPGPKTNALSRPRYLDIHPFLESDNFLTLKKLRYGSHEVGPVAGNLRVARSTFAIDQLEAGYRGGTITGQIRSTYRESDPTVSLRLNITGVHPDASNEVLDANAAITFVPRTLSLAGKIQIVRIGRDHLREVLNILDPFHEIASINKARLGLKLGFPKFVRLRLRDGTVDAKVELGGLAKTITIDEIKAIPLGPLLETYVAPFVPLADERTIESAEALSDELEEKP